MAELSLERPVVLVPGWGDTARSPWWDRFRHYLREIDPYVELASVDFSHRVSSELFDGTEALSVPLTAVGDVEDYAVDLEQEIAAIGEPVVVVAHSFGGLIARYALERLDAAEVTQLVTLGTPHQGTYKAVIASFSEGGRQMLPGSRFLNELNAGSLRTDVGYTAVWSDADDTIVKPWRARFPDALVDRHQDARNVMVEGFEHFGLLWSRHVLDVYLDRLAT